MWEYNNLKLEMCSLIILKFLIMDNGIFLKLIIMGRYFSFLFYTNLMKPRLPYVYLNNYFSVSL